jgi:mono/diheme cytochrome c family protein
MRPIIWISAFLFAATSTSAVLAQSSGEATYKTQCQLCHGESGTGDTQIGKALKAKSVLDPEVMKATDAELLAKIKNGTGKMPPFKDKLSDAQIQDVIAHIRTLEKK